VSKIFEALRKTHGEIAKLTLPMVDCEAPALVDEPSPHDGGEAQYDPGDIIPALEDRAEEPNGELRTLPVRIRSDGPILPFQSGYSRVGEQYRIARTKIIQHPGQPQLIAISSATSGDGKTVSAINLAGALALKSDARVLLVEADLRHPTISALLELPSQPGLSDYLAGTCSVEDVTIRVEQFPNLCFIPAGRSKINPTKLLESSRWPAACEEFRRRARFVIFDTPPVGTVAGYHLIEANCDGVIFIVRPDRTNRRLCLEGLANVANGKLMGVLMNGVTDWFLSKTKGYLAGAPGGLCIRT